MKNYVGIGLLVAALTSSAALAQNTANERSGTATEKTSTVASQHMAGQWRASKLPGVDVYNEQNEKIGDISDIILDASGKASKVIVGVGGFLGMGEHYVALEFDKLKWMKEPVRAKTATTNAPETTGTRAATNVDSNARTASDGGTRTATTGTASKRDSNDWYPDHAVYNATKDQLKSMPEFKY